MSSPSIQFDSIRFDSIHLDNHDDFATPDEFNINKTGFQFLTAPTSMTSPEFDIDEVVERVYYPESEALIKSVTGAEMVVIFDHSK